jgi:acetyl-CoA C-acetyltransferase
MAIRIGIIGEALRLERENLDWSNEDTVFFTVQEALSRTGLALDDIDTIVQAGDDVMDGIAINHVYTVEPSGSFLKDESKVERDGAWAVHYAIAKLMSGKFRTAMIVAQSKASVCDVSAWSGMSADPFYLRPVGADMHTVAALQAQYYGQASGLGPADFAQVAVKNRGNAAKNSRSMSGEGGQYQVDDILAARSIATPITELSAARTGDGCAVLFLATPEFIKERNLNAAYITGVGLSSDVYYPTFRELGRVRSAEQAAQAAYRMAGVSPGKVDFAEIHECYAHQELMLYEALGLCGAGQASAFLQEGRAEIGGELPVNPSGGVLGGNIVYASGLIRMLEAGLQLRGQAEDVQLKGVKRALVHAQGGLAMQANIAYILEA